MRFDAYRKWLGISSKRRPPTYYDLLGIEPGEGDNETIRSALEQRRAFIRSKRGEGHDNHVTKILGQIDEAASTLLVPEFKDAYDRQLGLHRKRTFLANRRSYVLPAWMESRIVRIYGEGSGVIVEAMGIVSIIFVAIALMVASGLWLKTQTSVSESSTELTWLEKASTPNSAKTDTPAEPVDVSKPAASVSPEPPSTDLPAPELQATREKPANVAPEPKIAPSKPLPEKSVGESSRSATTGEGVNPKQIRPSLAGDWSGSWQNEYKEKGSETLSIKQNDKDYITGLWSSNIPIQGERIGSDVIIFEGLNQHRQYRCVGFLEGDRLRLEYRAQPLKQSRHYYGWEEMKKGLGHSLPTPAKEKRRFAGTWSGTYENTRSQTGKKTLTLTEKNDAIAGDWSGIPVSGIRVGNTSFHLVGTNGKHGYNVVGRCEQDRLTLHYSATSKDERYFGKAQLSAQ